MGNMDGSLGTMLVGSYGATILYALEVIWAVHYYRHASSQDGLYLKALVAVTMVIDLADLIGELANIYLYCVSHWGDVEFLGHQYWPVPFCFCVESVSNAIVQGFLVLRYFRLSKNWYIGSALIAFMLVTLGSGLAVAILGTVWNEVEQRRLFDIPIKLWLIADVVTNVCTSLALIYEFHSKRTGLKTSNTIIRRLITLCIQSASIPSFCAIGALVSYLTRPEINISAIFLWFLPRAYILSMLHTLNVRQSIRDVSQVKSGGTIYTIGGINVLRAPSGQNDNGPNSFRLSEIIPNKTDVSGSSGQLESVLEEGNG